MEIRTFAPYRGATGGPPRPAGRESPYLRMPWSVDQLFEDFLGGSPGRQWLDERQVFPPLEISENDKAYVITAEVPGANEKDIEISLTDDVLTLKGEKTAESDHADAKMLMAERTYGAFARSLRLPTRVNTDKIEARFRNGVVTITLPKPLELQKATKTIALQAAA